MEPGLPATEAWSLSHGTSREVSKQRSLRECVPYLSQGSTFLPCDIVTKMGVIEKLNFQHCEEFHVPDGADCHSPGLNWICCLNLPASRGGQKGQTFFPSAHNPPRGTCYLTENPFLGYKLFFAFWSLNSFVWRLSTQALLQVGVQRWPRLPLQNTCFSVRGGFPSQEEMCLWVSPFCVSVCDVAGTLLEFSWRRACCSDTTLFPVFFSTSDVNIWRSVCLSLTPTSTKKRRAGRAEISWRGGWGWDLYVSVLSPLSLEQCLTPSKCSKKIFFKDFFFMGAIFELFIDFVTILFLFWFLPCKACGILALPSRGSNPHLLHWKTNHNHWTVREVPQKTWISENTEFSS